MSNPYPIEDPDIDECGRVVQSVEKLTDEVVGHRIVSAEKQKVVNPNRSWYGATEAFVITLDNGKQVQLFNSGDCCAFTELESFLLHPELVDHVILGVGTTDEYRVWHIYADMGDILQLTVGWSYGNPCYYSYGFDIRVVDVTPVTVGEVIRTLDDAQ